MGTTIGIGNYIGSSTQLGISNWTPQSIVVENAQPTKVVMTGTSANTTSVAGDFTIAGFTVSSLARDATNKILTLTLSTAVMYGDVLVVVYGGVSYSVTNNVALDTNAAAFLTATSITDETQVKAVNKFVVALKAINGTLASFVDFDTPANSILQACYPFVGGTDDKHKFNLVNPADTDGAFRLHYSGTYVNDAYGFKGNGSSGYADTHLSPRTVFGAASADHGVDVFINLHTVSAVLTCEIGAGAAGNDRLAFGTVDQTNQVTSMFDRGVFITIANGNECSNIGLNQINRVAAGIGNTKFIRNGRTILVNTADGAGTLPAETLTIAKFNGLTYYSARIISYVGVRKNAISDAANILYQDAIEKLQIALGRMPYKNAVFEGHSMMVGSGSATVLSRPLNKIPVSLNVTYANRLYNAYPAAVAGSTTADIVTRFAAVNGYKKAAPFNNILVVWIGVNDINTTDGSGATAWAASLGYINTAIAAGWTVVALTMTPTTAGWNKSQTAINNFNTLMKANAPAGCHVVDLTVHAELSNPANGTYFTDGLHLTAAGYDIVSADVVTEINTL